MPRKVVTLMMRGGASPEGAANAPPSLGSGSYGEAGTSSLSNLAEATTAMAPVPARPPRPLSPHDDRDCYWNGAPGPANMNSSPRQHAYHDAHESSQGFPRPPPPSHPLRRNYSLSLSASFQPPHYARHEHHYSREHAPKYVAPNSPGHSTADSRAGPLMSLPSAASWKDGRDGREGRDVSQSPPDHYARANDAAESKTLHENSSLRYPYPPPHDSKERGHHRSTSSTVFPPPSEHSRMQYAPRAHYPSQVLTPRQENEGGHEDERRLSPPKDSTPTGQDSLDGRGSSQYPHPPRYDYPEYPRERLEPSRQHHGHDRPPYYHHLEEKPSRYSDRSRTLPDSLDTSAHPLTRTPTGFLPPPHVSQIRTVSSNPSISNALSSSSASMSFGNNPSKSSSWEDSEHPHYHFLQSRYRMAPPYSQRAPPPYSPRQSSSPQGHPPPRQGRSKHSFGPPSPSHRAPPYEHAHYIKPHINHATYGEFLPPPDTKRPRLENYDRLSAGNEGSEPHEKDRQGIVTRHGFGHAAPAPYQQAGRSSTIDRQNPSQSPRELAVSTEASQSFSQTQSHRARHGAVNLPNPADLYARDTDVKLIPVYRYNNEHRNKSWEHMIQLFEKFIEKNKHGDVERDEEEKRLREDQKGEKSLEKETNEKLSVNDESDSSTRDQCGEKATKDVPSCNSESMNQEEDKLLMLRSWVRQIRWIRRSQGGDDDKKLAKNTKKATNNAEEGNESGKDTGVTERCDSETLTNKRIAQLDELQFPWRHERSAWQKWLDDLLHYKAKNEGCVNVPLKYQEYPSLGNFVNRQRTEYRKLMQGKSSSMTQSKIRDLERVGFLWSVREGGHTSWESRLMELRDYQKANGNCNVPKCYPPNPSLGYWVNEQRFQYRRLIKGKTSYMTQTKISSLNALGFVWTLRESKRPWSDWLEELRRYREEHGNVDVPLKYEKNVPLGAFVNNQRSEYRKLKKGQGNSSMTEEKIRDLENLGFQWSVRESRTPWLTRLNELKEYKKRYGNCDVPNSWPDNQPLSYWVSKQRQQYKLYASKQPCHLTDERINSLNEIGFDWRISAV